jgi:hypothetical protein
MHDAPAITCSAHRTAWSALPALLVALLLSVVADQITDRLSRGKRRRQASTRRGSSPAAAGRLGTTCHEGGCTSRTLRDPMHGHVLGLGAGAADARGRKLLEAIERHRHPDWGFASTTTGDGHADILVIDHVEAEESIGVRSLAFGVGRCLIRHDPLPFDQLVTELADHAGSEPAQMPSLPRLDDLSSEVIDGTPGAAGVVVLVSVVTVVDGGTLTDAIVGVISTLVGRDFRQEGGRSGCGECCSCHVSTSRSRVRVSR